jgi:hypothetical protein
VAVIFVISALNLFKVPLFMHVIDKTWKIVVLCNLYCACLLSLCVSKPNIEKYVFPEKEEVTERQSYVRLYFLFSAFYYQLVSSEKYIKPSLRCVAPSTHTQDQNCLNMCGSKYSIISSGGTGAVTY